MIFSFQSVPFVTQFLGGVKDDTVVIINGDILPSAKSVTVNFQTGSNENDDIPFHLNFRIDEGLVVSNTRQNGIWGTEERKFQVPFTKWHPFEFRIIITSKDYKVSVDRNLFTEYAHRIPIEQVKTLAVNGDIALKSVAIEAQGGLSHEKFDVNFRTGDVQKSDIAYQFNPRLEEGQVISNGRRNNNWLQSEAKSEMPFAREKPFELRFLVTDESYKVYVNGNYFLDYNHKIPLNQVNTLAIMGCVILNRVEIQAEAVNTSQSKKLSSEVDHVLWISSIMRHICVEVMWSNLNDFYRCGVERSQVYSCNKFINRDKVQLLENLN
ncbi:galectin-9-like [Bufo bufo]|uniref:galectin-9-like n=1 Tax=Bufo bufo TaxID=8384 RepID=UPI001ABE70D4|nr:galectin-9-like [Bufo bufo]